MIQFAPSILAADFTRLGEQVIETEEAGAHRVHIDVMDGHFVPNLSMGPEIVRCLKPVTKMALEVHLMITEPERYAKVFLDAGADIVIVHQEVLKDAKALFAEIRDRGKRVGLALNPNTDVELWRPHLPHIDVALCMTVHPGFSGQSYVEGSPDRIRTLRRMIDEVNPACELEVDGGINLETAQQSVAAGANVLAIASALFKKPNGPGAALREMQSTLSQTNQR